MAASAGTTTGSLQISAQVVDDCVITSATMPFGSYDPVLTNFSSAVLATGEIDLKCTNGDSYTVTGDTGLHAANAVNTTRALAGPSSNFLDYDLFTDNTYSTVWNASDPINGVGTGSAQAVSVYGRIPAQQTSGIAGNYSDTVTATITY